MDFNEEDFSLEFRKRFNQEEMQILMDFCKSYYAKFGKYVNRDEIISRMEQLGEFEHCYDEGADSLATHCVVTNNNYRKISRMYIEINDAKCKGFSIEEKKGVIYHELIHHFSTKEVEGKKVQSGLTPIDDKEINYVDEIMTEYYATELLKKENINLKKAVSSYGPKSRLDNTREYFFFEGMGYQRIAGLGKVYDKIFGKRFFDGKVDDYDKFEEKFNERFKTIGENPLEIINEELTQVASKKGVPVKDIAKDIYKCYQTAVEVFGIDRDVIYEKKGFDLYDYLKKSRAVAQSLPKKDINKYGKSNVRTNILDDKQIGIPEEIYDNLLNVDKEMIVKYMRPDILQIKDENAREVEINKVSTVINILRENIKDLSQEDINQITYGKIDEYTHNGLDCLVIKAGDKSFQTFVNNSTKKNFQFMPYSKFKDPKDYNDFYNTDIDQGMKERFKKEGKQLGDNYNISTIVNVGGQYGQYGLVEDNGKYYKTSGELQEVQIVDENTLISKTTAKEQKKVQEPKKTNKKKEWIKQFIEDYKASTVFFAGLRFNEEDENIQKVIDSVNAGKVDMSEGLTIDANNEQEYKVMGKLARLLIEADNLTIDGGEDYLEKFSNMKEINKLLLRIKNSQSVKEMQEKANKARIEGEYPKYYKKTPAEMDKQYAQKFIKSNIKQGSQQIKSQIQQQAQSQSQVQPQPQTQPQPQSQIQPQIQPQPQVQPQPQPQPQTQETALKKPSIFRRWMNKIKDFFKGNNMNNYYNSISEEQFKESKIEQAHEEKGKNNDNQEKKNEFVERLKIIKADKSMTVEEKAMAEKEVYRDISNGKMFSNIDKEEKTTNDDEGR